MAFDAEMETHTEKADEPGMELGTAILVILVAMPFIGSVISKDRNVPDDPLVHAYFGCYAIICGVVLLGSHYCDHKSFIFRGINRFLGKHCVDKGRRIAFYAAIPAFLYGCFLFYSGVTA